jgi:hypothetical protein
MCPNTDASIEMKKERGGGAERRKRTKAWVLLFCKAPVGSRAGADFDFIISLDVHPRRN